MGNVYTKSGALAQKIYFGSVLIWEKLVGSEFIIEVDTTKAGTSNNDQFQFTGAEGDYDVIAKQNNIVVATFNDLSGQQTITLPSSGVYFLEVSAKEVNGFTGVKFNNSGDKLKLSKINQWGIFNESRTGLFFNCNNLTEIASDNDWLNSITDGTGNFVGCNLTSLPDTLTLANLVNGASMFNGCNISELPSGMVLNNLENAELMFRFNSLSDLPSGLTFPNLTNGRLILQGSTLNTVRYSQLLIDMEAGNINIDVLFHAGNSKYNTDGETARNLLITNQNWAFTDGGLE